MVNIVNIIGSQPEKRIINDLVGKNILVQCNYLPEDYFNAIYSIWKTTKKLKTEDKTIKVISRKELFSSYKIPLKTKLKQIDCDVFFLANS